MPQEQAVVDVQTRNYDAAGHMHRDHALVNFFLSVAVRLRDSLDEAITDAHGVTLDTRQTAQWSDTTSTSWV